MGGTREVSCAAKRRSFPSHYSTGLDRQRSGQFTTGDCHLRQAKTLVVTASENTGSHPGSSLSFPPRVLTSGCFLPHFHPYWS